MINRTQAGTAHRPEPTTDAAERLTAWAECVQRLIAVAPTSAVIDETGIRWRGHSTPPERTAIRKEARAVVASWLARDLAALAEKQP